MLRLLEAGLWVAVVPTQADVLRLAKNKQLSEIRSRFYYTLQPTLLESLLDEATAAAIQSVRAFPSLADVQTSPWYQDNPIAIEVTATGEIVYDGRAEEIVHLIPNIRT